MQAPDKNVRDATFEDEALQKNGSRLYKTLLDHAPFAAFIIKDGHFCCYANHAAERLTGYSRDQLLRMRYLDIVHPDFRELVVSHLRARAEGNTATFRYELKIITGAREERWIDLNSTALDVAGERLTLATALDISEHKRHEESLLLSNFTIESSAEAIFWITRSGEIYRVNEAACKELGYTKEELQSLHVWDIDPIYTKEKFLSIDDELRRKKRLKFETIHTTKAGQWIPVEIQSNFLQYDGHEFACSFSRDITERKRFERALEESSARSELYLDLMGHDITNMNQAALGFLELADERLRSGGKLGMEDEALLSIPIANLLRSSKLIDNVRTLRKAMTGALGTRAMDVDGVVLDAVTRFTKPVPGRCVAIEHALSSHCRVKANDLLRDVFANLIENAIDHSRGPVTIGISTSCVEENGKRSCRISVEDNGPGIPDTRKGTLFTRSLAKGSGAYGSGFGLYMVRTLVEYFGGKVRVEDRVPGDYAQGARFVVLLPAVEN